MYRRYLIGLAVALAALGCGPGTKEAEHPADTSTPDKMPDLHVGDPLASDGDEQSGGSFGGLSFRADKTDKAPNIDGVLGSDWPKDMTKLTPQGKAAEGSFGAAAALLYDEKNLYVGADVQNDTIKGGATRVELVVASSGAPETFSLYPGQPGKSAARATKGGRPIGGAKVVEAVNGAGWSLEAAIPWATIGDGRTRVGLKGALLVKEGDSLKATTSTSTSTDLASLPALFTTPETALAEGLIKEKRLGAPQFSLTGDVAGNAEKERVLVFEKYLVVLGSGFHGGNDYYFSDMSTAGTTLRVLSCELRDVDGDGKKEIVLRKRYTEKSGVARDVLDIEAFGSSETPTSLLRHEIGISTSKGSISNEVAFVPEGGKLSVRINSGSAKGYTHDSFDQGVETSFDPVLLPWDTDSQTYKMSGATFALASTTKHKDSESKKNDSVANTPSPPPPTRQTGPSKPDSDKVYAMYKQDRGISGAPKFDLSGDVDGDGTSERVLLHDKDLVVFGPSFKGGTAYAYTTLSFDKSDDISSVTLKSVTGEKRTEIVVRGVLRARAPKDAGGDSVEREIELVYRVDGGALKRIFAAEVGRSIGSNKIVASLSYSGGKATLAPGRAIGFTKETYPFNQDTGPVGGVEPLPLPWGDAKSTTYTWDGSSFSK